MLSSEKLRKPSNRWQLNASGYLFLDDMPYGIVRGMKLLSLSTSSVACSVALVANETVYIRHEIVANQHTQLILPMIDSVLAEGGLQKQDLNAIALDEGPGSFTGLRIGLGVAQGLALGLNIPVYPVSSLQVIAIEALQVLTQPFMGNIYCALDARMQEAYWAQYQVHDNVLTTVQKPQITAIESLHPLRELDPTGLFVGTAWNDIAHTYPHARSVAQLALLKIKQGDQGLQSVEVKPVYLRDKVAKKSS